MPLLEVLALDGGASIGKAILKCWLGSGSPVSDAASSIVDVLRTQTSDRIAQCTLFCPDKSEIKASDEG
jgi:hypothetical protein